MLELSSLRRSSKTYIFPCHMVIVRERNPQGKVRENDGRDNYGTALDAFDPYWLKCTEDAICSTSFTVLDASWRA